MLRSAIPATTAHTSRVTVRPYGTPAWLHPESRSDGTMVDVGFNPRPLVTPSRFTAPVTCRQSAALVP